MGKRELLLAAAFLIAGVLVYQFTAPPPAPGERSFSLSQIVNNVRREIRGNRANAETTTTSTHALPASVTELRLSLGRVDVTMTGEDRKDIEAQLQVRSTGFDVPEAERLAKESILTLEDAGSSVLGRMTFPEAGRQTAKLTLKVPARLAVRMDANSGELTLTNLASVELVNARRETRLARIAGRVTATQTGGILRVLDAGSLKLTTRGADAVLEDIRGESLLNLRDGEVKGSRLIGPVELETHGTDVTFDKLEQATGTWRCNTVNGTLTLRGLRTDGRIDARNTGVSVDIDRAAPLSIYAEGEDTVNVTAPAGGYQLDAVALRGEITLPEGTLQVAANGQERRAAGAVGGGGPTITIRATRGNIAIKKHAR